MVGRESTRTKSPPPSKLMDDIYDVKLLTDPNHQLSSIKVNLNYSSLMGLLPLE